ncbi:MAG: flagellar biosynthesis anti-sigma factor FlgM [Armatimonadota bacterium]|nr:flagellar biosynthesis anti-sigma factor FlgM [Armatimonadota bacterium]
MHVSNAQIQKVLDLHLHRVYGLREVQDAGPARGTDELILSRKATDVREIKRQVAGLPDMRAGVVKGFRSKVQAGDYKVSESEVAEKMLAAALQSRTRL